MGKVTNFPGHNCVHYSFGRCKYEEYLNPGYHSTWQCRVLAFLEKDYDGLIRQADVFDLSLDQVEKIWEKKFEKIRSWADFCDSYLQSGPEDDRCACLFGNACILLMPECTGVCRLFKPRVQKDIES